MSLVCGRGVSSVGWFSRVTGWLSPLPHLFFLALFGRVLGGCGRSAVEKWFCNRLAVFVP